MSFDDAGNIVFARDTTNRQFIEGLNMLGLLSAEHSEGKTDYDWLALAMLGAKKTQHV